MTPGSGQRAWPHCGGSRTEAGTRPVPILGAMNAVLVWVLIAAAVITSAIALVALAAVLWGLRHQLREKENREH